MADKWLITLQGLSAITRFIGRSTFQTQDQHLVLGWFVITTNHPLKRWAVWLFLGTSLEKEPTRVCPLEREKPLRRLAVFAGALTSLQFDPHRFLKRCQLRSRLIQCSSGTCLRRENVPLRLVFTFDLHVQEWDSCRKVVTLDWLAANDSEPSPQQRASVRAVRRFLGRKTAKPTATPWIYPRRSTSTGVSKASKCRPLATRFFDVLTAPVIQEKNHEL